MLTARVRSRKMRKKLATRMKNRKVSIMLTARVKNRKVSIMLTTRMDYILLTLDAGDESSEFVVEGRRGLFCPASSGRVS